MLLLFIFALYSIGPAFCGSGCNRWQDLSSTGGPQLKIHSCKKGHKFSFSPTRELLKTLRQFFIDFPEQDSIDNNEEEKQPKKLQAFTSNRQPFATWTIALCSGRQWPCSSRNLHKLKFLPFLNINPPPA